MTRSKSSMTAAFSPRRRNERFHKSILVTEEYPDYLFVEGTAEESVERRFAQDLEDASEVAVYAKLPRGFAIPTRLAIILRTGRLRSTRER